MKVLTFVLLLIFSTALSQQKYELQEFTGTVVEIRPGWGFALEVIELQVKDEIRPFKINPKYGKQILSQIQKGQTISIKANVNLVFNNYVQENKDRKGALPDYFFDDQITEIKITGNWIQTPSPPREVIDVKSLPRAKVFIEQKVEGDFFVNGLRKGLIFQNGMVSFANYFTISRNPMKTINPGDVVSFMGYESPVKDEFIFPIKNVKEVYSFTKLKRLEGKIEAFIHKQNYVRIGMVINGKRLSFPAESALEIERFANDRNVIVYFNDIDDGPKSGPDFFVISNLLPTIHAVVQDSDTLYFASSYFGGPDGKHEHKAVQVEGTITKVNRNDKGRVISLIVAKDCFIEIDPQMATQLGNLLKKGTTLKVSGEERIKKDGEIYEKDYRIITPKRIIADQREYIVNQ